MPTPDPSQLHRFAAALPERTGSFAERGVLVPFTAPLLAGVRLRRIKGGQPELLLPAFGGRGVYVLDWNACLSFCAPSLHDRRIWCSVEHLMAPTPADIRDVARNTARQGHAGRAAAHAALAQAAALAEAERQTETALRQRLGPPPAGSDSILPEFAGFAHALTFTGAGPLPTGPLAALLARIENLVSGVEAWRRTGPAGEIQRMSAVLLHGARLTLVAAQAAMASLWPLLAAPRHLFDANAQGAPAAVARMAERVDWVLDGWSWLAGLWACTRPDEREAVVAEMHSAMPILPLEVDGWAGPPGDWDNILRARRLHPPRPAWSCGNLVMVMARNENVRAAAA